MVSETERRKDTIQVAVESAATHFGRIAGIVAEAVRDVTAEIGEFATDLFEMNEASRRAERDSATNEDDPLEEPSRPV